MAKKKLKLSVVGMIHRVSPSSLSALEKEAPLKCELEREPDNEHDRNAVKVVVTEKPWATKHGGFHVGYIKRQVASEIAPRMDRGAWPYTEAWLVSVDAETGSGEVLLKVGRK